VSCDTWRIYRTGGRDSRPAPVLGDTGQLRLDGVLEHVFERRGELRVAFDELRREAFAENVVAAPATLVEATRVATVEVAHPVGEVRLGCLDDEVVVRAEEAVSVDSPGVAADDTVEELEEETAVLVIPEDEGAAVPSCGDVVVRACLLVAQRSGHRGDASGRSAVDGRGGGNRGTIFTPTSRARHETGRISQAPFGLAGPSEISCLPDGWPDPGCHDRGALLRRPVPGIGQGREGPRSLRTVGADELRWGVR